ncbi:MAG: DNA primase [Candidatus Berkelbacteria bacterium]|nr:DNA primase [Candidatus Berkelbacteria bacterium]
MNQVEEVKNKIDIVELISGYLTLKKAGINYKGLCPFHNEKTPSFMVSPERQGFKCFGCSAGGDVFTFVEMIECMEFYDSLKFLAEKAGIELKKDKPFSYGEKKFEPSEKSRIFEINDLSAKFYHKILTDHPKAEPARKYLRDRGIKKETIVDWKLGYAPNSWDLILKFLTARGFSDKEIFRAGLLVLGDKGKYWDRFRGRIMFPISNISGQIVAFTSRVIDDSDPKAAKYLNSAESPIYIKGKTIYGLDRARNEIRQSGKSIMVEGNMDVIACQAAGFKNVVATSGTALTSDQLKILARYSPDIIFSFDSDAAGKTALKRAITLALQNDINARVLTLPGFKDPDEAIKSDPKNFSQAIKNSKSALEYWIDTAVLENDIADVSGKKNVSKEILPVLKIISNDLEREYYIKYLAKKLSLSESSILSQLKKTSEPQLSNYSPDELSKVENQKLSFERRVAGLVWQDKNLANELPPAFFDLNFTDQIVKDFFDLIKFGEDWSKKISSPTKTYLDGLAMQATKDLDQTEDEIIKKEFNSLMKSFAEKKKEKIKTNFAADIAAAEAAGDRDKIKQLMKEFQSAIIK